MGLIYYLTAEDLNEKLSADEKMIKESKIVCLSRGKSLPKCLKSHRGAGPADKEQLDLTNLEDWRWGDMVIMLPPGVDVSNLPKVKKSQPKVNKLVVVKKELQDDDIKETKGDDLFGSY